MTSSKLHEMVALGDNENQSKIPAAIEKGVWNLLSKDPDMISQTDVFCKVYFSLCRNNDISKLLQYFVTDKYADLEAEIEYLERFPDGISLQNMNHYA